MTTHTCPPNTKKRLYSTREEREVGGTQSHASYSSISAHFGISDTYETARAMIRCWFFVPYLFGKRKRQNLCRMVIPSHLHLLRMSQVMRGGEGRNCFFVAGFFICHRCFRGGGDSFLGVILVYERPCRLSSSSFSWCTWAPMVFWVYILVKA